MSEAKRKAAVAEFMATQEHGVTLVEVAVLSYPNPDYKSEMLIIETSSVVDGKIVNKSNCVFVDK